mgnify:CR=1 FL=1
MKADTPAMILTKARIRNGTWEGVLSGPVEKPDLAVRHLGVDVPGLSVVPLPDRPGEWAIRVPIPVAALNDGVQTFLICQRDTDQALNHFTIIAGVAMEDDLRAEIDLLRAELDMLKKAFRRHCLESGS